MDMAMGISMTVAPSPAPIPDMRIEIKKRVIAMSHGIHLEA
jgi:hypothetical protein